MSSIYNPTLELKNASDQEIIAILAEHNLSSITADEARKIVEMLGRNPTLTEGVIWSIQGSEHSSYKSSRKFLKNLPTDATPVILGPCEDAGIVKMCDAGGDSFGLVYSHESHNSPSQLVPFEGAATGVGGICRDIACMGARVIGCMDSLRFGNPKEQKNQVIARGVIEGVAGYANPLGVPNMGGDIAFDESYDGFTLVNVVAMGLVKEKNILHSYAPKDAAEKGYELIVVGKGSDKSGFGGASFSSSVVDESQKEKNLGAVQEPNPFLERHLLSAFQDLFTILEKKGELNTIGFKDMGAGGIMCASVELAEGAGFGAEVDVENIHTGEDGLPPHIILCSETQERFCFAVPPHLTEFFLDHFNKKWDLPGVSNNAKASKIGRIIKEPRYKVKYKGETICDANIKDITEGLLIDRPYDLPNPKYKDTVIPKIENLSDFLIKFLARPNMADTTCVHENYDQTVQGSTVLQRNESEAVVAAPLRDFDNLTKEEQKNGFAVSVAGSPHLGGVSPYAQGVHAVVTAIQKVAATGAKPRSLTDCLNYGNPELRDDMGKFVDGITGVANGAKNLHLYEYQDEPTPFISGNVSLYKRGNPSAIVSAIGVITDSTKAVGNIMKADEFVYLVGQRPEEIGGTEFAKTQNLKNIAPATINCETAEKLTFAVIEGNETQKFSSVSVIDRGGLIGTLLQALLRSNLGFEGDMKKFPTGELFSEGNGFLVSIDSKKQEEVEKFLKEKNISFTLLGKTNQTDTIEAENFSLKRKELEAGWKSGLRGGVL